MTISDSEYEMIKTKILLEFGDKLDAVIRDLNCNGSEFARSLKLELENLKENTHSQIEEVWSWVKSHFVLIDTIQKMWCDPKDGIMVKVLQKAETAVKFATDAATCTVEARKAADDARLYIRANIFVTGGVFLGILITVISGYLAITSKAHEDLLNQKSMIIALQEKIKQDAENQRETVSYLKELDQTLRKVITR